MAAADPPSATSTRAGRRWTPAPPDRGTPGTAAAPLYRPRRPTETPLYPVVQHHLETFLARAEDGDPLGYGVPGWVEKDFRAYLRCGIPAHGVAHIRCGDCGQERLLPFSCKGRGVCPSCNARRMADVAARLTDHVLPHLPLRQWVLSVPKRLRPYLHHDPRLAGAVLRIFVRVIRSELGRRSPGAPPGARIAAVSFPQRFGSSLNPHFHYHVLALDGVFSEESPGEVRFHEAALLSPEKAREVARTVQRRVLRLFRRRGFLDDTAADDMLTWQATGGFSVDASVRVEGDDRAGIERLVRYCARPPLALERLHALGDSATLASEDARLLYRLPEPDLEGRSALVLSPLELLQRLSRLIPPPRVHRHRYHGVLAPNAALRARVVALGRDEDSAVEAAASAGAGGAPTRSAAHHSRAPHLERAAPPATPQQAAARSRWARLLARIYEVFPLQCPDCGADMRILAFLPGHEPVGAILRRLGLPASPPPLSPARGPPQHDLGFDADHSLDLDLDQTPAFDPTEPEPVPDFDVDPSCGD